MVEGFSVRQPLGYASAAPADWPELFRPFQSVGEKAQHALVEIVGFDPVEARLILVMRLHCRRRDAIHLRLEAVAILVRPQRLQLLFQVARMVAGDLGMAFEHALREGLPGKRARVDALGYMPRGFIGAISKVDQQEAFDAGAFAVHVAGEGGGSVALKHEGDRIVMRKVPLINVAGKTPHMPADFLDAAGTGLSDTGRAYFERLVPKKYDIGKPFV